VFGGLLTKWKTARPKKQLYYKKRRNMTRKTPAAPLLKKLIDKATGIGTITNTNKRRIKAKRKSNAPILTFRKS